MKITCVLLLLVLHIQSIALSPSSGFFLPDSLNEVTFRYRSRENLIILPAIINDSIHVNLILDTGCRNIVLFGKKFSRILSSPEDRPVKVNGLGKGKGTTGLLSVENRISIDIVRGLRIPVVVVPQRSLFTGMPEVDGVVGYEIFSRFEVEINFPAQRITFRSGHHQTKLTGFDTVPLLIEDSKPVISANVSSNHVNEKRTLLIDTGSCLALLVAAQKNSRASTDLKKVIIGRGFNGTVTGNLIENGELRFNDSFSIRNITTSMIETEEAHASIGTGLLKNYILILNYAKGYAALRLTVN